MIDYFRYDPHVHTSEVSSCGQVTAADMVKLYHQTGYQGLIITDHYYSGFVERRGYPWDEVIDHFLSGYRNAYKAARNLDMDILLGMEIRFDDSSEDYLIFGFEEDFLYQHPYLNRLTPRTFKQLTLNQGILVVQAHPYRIGMHPADVEDLAGVEAFNGNPRHDSHNDRAYAFGRTNGLYLLAGSDAHQPQDVGNGGIGLTERIGTSADLVAWMVSGRPYDLIHRW